MPFKKTKRKIQQLNQESEAVRMRAAIRLSVVVGIIIIPVALLGLLPLQLKLQDTPSLAEQRQTSRQVNQSPSIISRIKQFTGRQASNEKTNTNAPQVGGVLDINNGDNQIPDFLKTAPQQQTFNNNTEFPTSTLRPPFDKKSFDTNNIPVEITP